MTNPDPFELFIPYLKAQPGNQVFFVEGGENNNAKRHELEDGRIAVVEDPTIHIKSAQVLVWYGLNPQKLHSVVLLLDTGDILTRELVWDPAHPLTNQKAKPAHTAKIYLPDLFETEDKLREFLKAQHEGWRYKSPQSEDVQEYFATETFLTLPEILVKMGEELTHTPLKFLNAGNNRDKRLTLDPTGKGHGDPIYDDMVIEVRNEMAERLLATAEQYEQIIDRDHKKQFGKKG